MKANTSHKGTRVKGASKTKQNKTQRQCWTSTVTLDWAGASKQDRRDGGIILFGKKKEGF